MTNCKSVVYVFAMPFGETELENVEPITPKNHLDYLGFEGARIERKYNARICDGHYHFERPVTLATVASFIQEIANIMLTPFYFALKKNGRIWIAERKDEEDIIHTPEGPFRVRVVDLGGDEAGIITFDNVKKELDRKNEEIKKLNEKHML